MSNSNASIKFTSAAYFTFDHIHKTIVGSEFNFKMAGNPTKPQYDALMAAMKLQPSYTLSAVAPKKEKQSYKGLNSKLIDEYIEIFGTEVQKAELKSMVDSGEGYPAIKSWFLDYFKVGFTAEKAKSRIATAKRKNAHESLKAKKANVRKVVKAKMSKATPAADAA